MSEQRVFEDSKVFTSAPTVVTGGGPNRSADSLERTAGSGGEPRSSERPAVVYLVRHEALASIFASQVLAPLARLTEACDVRLAVHVPIGQLVRPQWRRKLNE